MSVLERFIIANQRLSGAIERRLPTVFRQHIYTVYKYKAAELINRRSRQIVLDVGGGKDCPFLPFLKAPCGHLIVALDISQEELRRNRQLANKIVADAASDRLPLRDGSIDLVLSRSVVEHIRDNAVFFANCARVLRPGGIMMHAFPGRFAPFALMNQLLPNRLARRLVGYLHPHWREEDNYGFLAYYNRCYFSALKDLLHKNDFTNSGSIYFITKAFILIFSFHFTF